MFHIWLPSLRPLRGPGYPQITNACRGAAREGSQMRSVWIQGIQIFRVEDAEESLAHLPMRTFWLWIEPRCFTSGSSVFEYSALKTPEELPGHRGDISSASADAHVFYLPTVP